MYHGTNHINKSISEIIDGVVAQKHATLIWACHSSKNKHDILA
jgi:hypothetical protein